MDFLRESRRYLWKMFTSLPESSVVPQLWNKPWWTSSNFFCQITSYPKLQEERFKKENTDFNNGNGCSEQLRTGNIRTSKNQTSQQETPNNLDYKNCWAHNTEVIAVVPRAIQCSHIHTTLLSRTLIVFCSFQDFPYFLPFLLPRIWAFTTFKTCQAGEGAEPGAPALAACPAASTARCLSNLNNPDGERDHQTKNKTKKIHNSNHRKGWWLALSDLSCFFSCTSKTITRRG